MPAERFPHRPPPTSAYAYPPQHHQQYQSHPHPQQQQARPPLPFERPPPRQSFSSSTSSSRNSSFASSSSSSSSSSSLPPSAHGWTSEGGQQGRTFSSPVPHLLPSSHSMSASPGSTLDSDGPGTPRSGSRSSTAVSNRSGSGLGGGGAGHRPNVGGESSFLGEWDGGRGSYVGGGGQYGHQVHQSRPPHIFGSDSYGSDGLGGDGSVYGVGNEPDVSGTFGGPVVIQGPSYYNGFKSYLPQPPIVYSHPTNSSYNPSSSGSTTSSSSASTHPSSPINPHTSHYPSQQNLEQHPQHFSPLSPAPAIYPNIDIVASLGSRPFDDVAPPSQSEIAMFGIGQVEMERSILHGDPPPSSSGDVVMEERGEVVAGTGGGEDEFGISSVSCKRCRMHGVECAWPGEEGVGACGNCFFSYNICTPCPPISSRAAAAVAALPSAQPSLFLLPQQPLPPNPTASLLAEGELTPKQTPRLPIPSSDQSMVISSSGSATPTRLCPSSTPAPAGNANHPSSSSSFLSAIEIGSKDPNPPPPIGPTPPIAILVSSPNASTKEIDGEKPPSFSSSDRPNSSSSTSSSSPSLPPPSTSSPLSSSTSAPSSTSLSPSPSSSSSSSQSKPSFNPSSTTSFSSSSSSSSLSSSPSEPLSQIFTSILHLQTTANTTLSSIYHSLRPENSSHLPRLSSPSYPSPSLLVTKGKGREVIGSEEEKEEEDQEQSSTVGVATRVGKRRESFERTHPVEVEADDDDGWREEGVAVANAGGEKRTALAATAVAAVAAARIVGG